MGRTVAVAEVLALPAALPQTVPSPHLPSPHGFRGAGGQGDMRGPLGMGHRWSATGYSAVCGERHGLVVEILVTLFFGINGRVKHRATLIYE